MRKQQICRAVCFLALAACMLGGLSWLLRDRITTMSALYSEPKDTVDVCLVGSSHVNSGCMPDLLWRDHGISAANVYSWSQPMWVSYYYIQEALKTQSPSVIVLDLNGMLYGNSIEQPQEADKTSYRNSFNLDTSLNLLRLIGTVKNCGIDLRDPIDFLPLVRYHTRWKNLDEAAFTYSAHRDYDPLHGYGFQVEVYPQQMPQYPATQQRQQPYETAVTYLDKIVSLSKEKDFDLVFILTPYVYQENEPAIFNWLADYAQENEIPFINYCDAAESERIGLDWQTDFCDGDHLNYLGAQKLTADLGRFLQQNGYALRGREQLPNAEQRDADAAVQQRIIDLWEITQKDPDSFFDWAVQNGALAVSADAAAEESFSVTWQQLQQAGFTGLAELNGSGYYAAVAEQGTVQQITARESGQTVQGELLCAEACSGGAAQCGSYRQAGSGLEILYYDPLLQRPVYRIAAAADGTLTFTDLGADLEF